MVARLACGPNRFTLSPPSGWTSIRTESVQGTLKQRLWCRVAASEGSSYTFTVDAADDLIVEIISYSGVSSFPFDTSSGQTGTGTSVTAPSATLGMMLADLHQSPDPATSIGLAITTGPKVSTTQTLLGPSLTTMTYVDLQTAE